MAKEHKASAHAADDHRDRFEGQGMSTGVAIVGFLLCFLAGAGLMYGYDQYKLKKGDISADSSTASWSDDDSPVPVSSKDPVWGSRSAPVTVVIFSDFECPFCSRVEPTLDQVKTTYGPDKVRLVWKNEPLPFHASAKPAAEAAQGVFAMKGSEAFWKFHDTAFKNQKALNADNFKKWAKEAGVTDLAGYEQGLKSNKWASKVEQDHEVAKKAGISGTPGFLINGVLLSGAQPFEKFKTVIDQELQKAQAKIASGTPKDKVYVAMTTENKKNAPAQEDDEEKEDTKTVFKVPVGNSAFKGKADAPVTIVEFSDFECPFCKRVEPTLEQVKTTYGDKVRLVWKHAPLPFHKKAIPASILSLEARAQKGDKGFWDAHAKLFENQQKLDDADLEKYAQELGLDVNKFKDALKNQKYKKDIDADLELGDDVQANGTPHFFINGRRLVGAQPFEKFKAIIDDEVKKAQDLVSKGTPAAQVYETLIKDGKGAPDPEKKNVAAPPPNAPSKGNPKAKVVIQEFSDFQCPFCARAEDSVKEVMKNYGDRVKFVWRDLPLPMHSDAPLAAQAAREALKQKGPDAFWKMHDKLYESQKDLKRESLDKIAKDLGLDMDKFKAALDNQTHKAEVDADAKAGGDAGISGTPAFVINGYFISGAQPYPKFRKLIERALAEAK